MKIDIIKVWVFFLKNENVPYAFTSIKEYKTRFLEERNTKCFDVNKLELDELEFSLFMNKNRSIMLSEMPLNTSLTEYVNILMTPIEYEKLHHEASHMDFEIERISKEFSKLKLKDKYLDAIKYLSDIEYLVNRKSGETDRLSKVNLLFLFRILFKNTFEWGDE